MGPRLAPWRRCRGCGTRKCGGGDVRALRVSKNRDGRSRPRRRPMSRYLVCRSSSVYKTGAASRKPKPPGKWLEAICEQLKLLGQRAALAQIAASIAANPLPRRKPVGERRFEPRAQAGRFGRSHLARGGINPLFPTAPPRLLCRTRPQNAVLHWLSFI